MIRFCDIPKIFRLADRPNKDPIGLVSLDHVGHVVSICFPHLPVGVAFVSTRNPVANVESVYEVGRLLGKAVSERHGNPQPDRKAKLKQW